RLRASVRSCPLARPFTRSSPRRRTSVRTLPSTVHRPPSTAHRPPSITPDPCPSPATPPSPPPRPSKSPASGVASRPPTWSPHSPRPLPPLHAPPPPVHHPLPIPVPRAGVRAALPTVQEPDRGPGLVALDTVPALTVRRRRVSFTVVLTTPACPLNDLIRSR